jgi:hypothetical protein
MFAQPRLEVSDANLLHVSIMTRSSHGGNWGAQSPPRHAHDTRPQQIGAVVIDTRDAAEDQRPPAFEARPSPS